MTDEDKISLSRRKALGAMGTIGAAGALGTMGTLAQFSDTEENVVSFTAGGIDGTISWSGHYNGSPVDGSRSDRVNLSPGGSFGPQGVSVDVAFTDIKPGDYGCVNFGITVESNAAWVASCLNIEEDIDNKAWEPEKEIEDTDGDDDYEVQNLNVSDKFDIDYNPNVTAHPGDSQPGNDLDIFGQPGTGELAERILTIPYYDGDDSCRFFDNNGPQHVTSDLDTLVAPSGFFSNSQTGIGYQGSPFETKEGVEYWLAPRILRGAANVSAADTAHWKSGPSQGLEFENAPSGANVDSGCVMLEGDVATYQQSGNMNNYPGNNTQGVSPLQPGEELNFGYDFHLPFETGNAAQGDSLTLSLGFLFLQSRHTSAPDFTQYSPGDNLPS